MKVLVLMGPNGPVSDEQIKYAGKSIAFGLGKAQVTMDIRNGTGYGSEIETEITSIYRRTNTDLTIGVLGVSSTIPIGNYDGLIVIGEFDELVKGFIRVFMGEKPKGKILHFAHPLYAGEDPQKISAAEGYAYKATQARILKSIADEVQTFFKA